MTWFRKMPWASGLFIAWEIENIKYSSRAGAENEQTHRSRTAAAYGAVFMALSLSSLMKYRRYTRLNTKEVFIPPKAKLLDIRCSIARRRGAPMM